MIAIIGLQERAPVAATPLPSDSRASVHQARRLTPVHHSRLIPPLRALSDQKAGRRSRRESRPAIRAGPPTAGKSRSALPRRTPAPTLTRLARPNNSKVISPLLGRDVRLASWYLKRYATAFSPHVALSFR